MTERKVTRKVVSVWGLIMLILVKLVAPMPTANRWLYKMGESTNNLLNYGFANFENLTSRASLSILSLR